MHPDCTVAGARHCSTAAGHMSQGRGQEASPETERKAAVLMGSPGEHSTQGPGCAFLGAENKPKHPWQEPRWRGDSLTEPWHKALAVGTVWLLVAGVL